MASLCFFANLLRKALRLMSLFGCFGSLADSKSSMSAFATSAQHRRKRSFSGARTASFLRAVVVIVVVAISKSASESRVSRH